MSDTFLHANQQGNERRLREAEAAGFDAHLQPGLSQLRGTAINPQSAGRERAAERAAIRNRTFLQQAGDLGLSLGGIRQSPANARFGKPDPGFFRTEEERQARIAASPINAPVEPITTTLTPPSIEDFSKEIIPEFQPTVAQQVFRAPQADIDAEAILAEGGVGGAGAAKPESPDVNPEAQQRAREIVQSQQALEETVGRTGGEAAVLEDPFLGPIIGGLEAVTAEGDQGIVSRLQQNLGSFGEDFNQRIRELLGFNVTGLLPAGEQVIEQGFADPTEFAERREAEILEEQQEAELFEEIRQRVANAEFADRTGTFDRAEFIAEFFRNR